MALSQLSRESEKRKDKTPMLSDLRESGAIEQDADVVMFIHRPEYYGITEDEEGKTTKGVAEIIIAKNRSGQPESYKLNFIGKCAKYTDLSHESSNYDVINAILNLIFAPPPVVNLAKPERPFSSPQSFPDQSDVLANFSS